MNKLELIETTATATNLQKKQVENVLEVIIATIVSTLKSGGDVALTGFGTFTTSKRAARMGINPQKPGTKIHIAARTVPKFKPGKGLKEAVK